MQPYNQARLARRVMGMSNQVEPADREVTDGTNNVAYKEQLNDGSWSVELEDGSRHLLPPRAQATFEKDWLYDQLES